MIIASNFKACKTRQETQNYFDALNSFIRVHGNRQEVLVFVPASSFLPKQQGAVMGAQNAYPVQNGAYTGETALEQLDEFGINTLLIGHSERRELLGERQDLIAKKFDFFKAKGFRICYCIGEPLSIKEQGEEAIIAYLDKEFEGIDLSYENMMIAYEPIWAIGTGLTPSNEEIDAILGRLKTKCHKPILYGGSVKKENAKAILSLKHCDGVLVGSAALDVEVFTSMLSDAQSIEDKTSKN